MLKFNFLTWHISSGSKRSHLLSLLGLIFTLVSCSHQPLREPAMTFSEGVRLPEMNRVVLPNGLNVLFIKDSTLPRISFTALVGVGSTSDSKNKLGLSSMTANLLEEGTESYSSEQLSDLLEGLGAAYDTRPGHDFTISSLSGLSNSKETLFSSWLQILFHPTFPEKEFQTLKSQTLSSLRKLGDDPGQFADLLESKEIFGQHAYGWSSLGRTDTLKAVTRSDVLKFYQENYRPQNTSVAVVGEFDDAFQDRVQKELSLWLKDQKTQIVKSNSFKPNPTQGLIKLKSKKGLVQAQIRIVQPLIERSHPDYMLIRLANMALGGNFGSRLNQYVRDDLGLTYNISSEIDARLLTGQWVVDTFTRNDKVKETIVASKKVVSDFVDKGLTADELETAKSILIGQFPRAVETMESLAFQLLLLDFYKIDKSYLTQFISNVNSVTLADVNQAIKNHFHPNKMDIVIYGDGRAIGAALKTLGPVKEL